MRAAASEAEYQIPGATGEVAAADGEVGIFFEQQDGMVVYCTDVPEPGMTFPVETSGMFPVEVSVYDADGNKLGDIEDVAGGMIDYSAYPNAAKIVVEGGAAAPSAEYEIPAQ